MKMDNSHWQRLQKLFDAAADLPAAERAAYLERECGSDPTLRRQVESLVYASEDASDFIGRAVQSGADAVVATAAWAAGKRIGPYEIVRELGRGGMGTVFLARRFDDVYQAFVAIKAADRALRSREMLQRFRSERQILADLSHPNIAKLLDGGTTEDGVPYVVMEHVDGLPIDEYCDAHQLSVGERVALFRSICGAVQHAHRNLIVHRDLKPPNILVTADGVPKLLDFGIAKLLDPETSPHTVAETRTDMRLMTPTYASPEQVRGGTITVASDVYALGVVLYELLTGRLPYEFKSYGTRDIEQVITETDPIRPSTAVSKQAEHISDDGTPVAITTDEICRRRKTVPDRLRRTLAGDLDTIVLMALRKEPDRRYASVEMLAEDLRHYSVGLPVRAQRDTWRYRAGKFVRRHRVGVAAAAVVVVLLAGFAITMAVQAQRIARERDTAALERENAEQVTDFLVDLFLVSDPQENLGQEITAREVLERGAARIDSELVDQPEIRATMLETMSRVYNNMGQLDQALTFLSEARTLREDLADGRATAELAAVLHSQGIVQLERGEFAEAESLLVRSMEMRRELFGENSEEVVDTKSVYGWLLFTQGHYDRAEPLLLDASEWAETILADGAVERLDPSTVTDEQLELYDGAATIINNLGALYSYQGRLDEAETVNRRVLEIRRHVVGNDHPSVMVTLNNLGNLLREKGEYADAEPMLEEALAINRTLHGRHPRVAISLHNLSLAKVALGDYDAAEALDREALSMRRELLNEEHPDIANTLHNLGWQRLERGAYEEAEGYFRDAIAQWGKTFPDDHPNFVTAYRNLGHTLVELGRFAAADSALSRSLELSEAVFGERHANTATTLLRLGDLQRRRGDPSAAEATLTRALEIRRTEFDATDWRIAEVELALGRCLNDLERFEDAEPLLTNAFDTMRDRYGADDDATRDAVEAVVALYRAWGRPEMADRYAPR
jgi:serine/threonine-protein kinase